RRLVDQQRDARRRLERLDVAPLAADDPALHLLARELDDRRGEVVVRLARDPLHRGDEDPPRLGLQFLLGLFERRAAQRAQLVLALEQNLLAQLPADFLRVHLRYALEPLAHALRQRADRVARLLDRGALAVEPLLPLLELVVEQRQRLLVRADFAQPDVALDLAPVEVAVQLRALLLDLALDLLLHLLGRHRGFAPRDLDELRRLFVRDAPRVPRERPDNEEPDAAAYDKEDRERPVKGVALGEQKSE